MKRGKARDVDKIPGFKGRIWGSGARWGPVAGKFTLNGVRGGRNSQFWGGGGRNAEFGLRKRTENEHAEEYRFWEWESGIWGFGGSRNLI